MLPSLDGPLFQAPSVTRTNSSRLWAAALNQKDRGLPRPGSTCGLLGKGHIDHTNHGHGAPRAHLDEGDDTGPWDEDGPWACRAGVQGRLC